jgi:hypothetical protein
MHVLLRSRNGKKSDDKAGDACASFALMLIWIP